MLVFASWGTAEHGVNPVKLIIEWADGLGQGQLLRVGWVRTDVIVRVTTPTRAGDTDGDVEANRWFRVKSSALHSELLLAVLHAAAAHFGLCGCIGARIGRAVSAVEGIDECSYTFVWWWHTDRPQQ